MLSDVQERMNANIKTMQEKADANRGQMLAKIDANTEAMRQDIKSGQAEMRSRVGHIEEKMDAWIANMRDDEKERTSLQETMEACLECKEPTSADMKVCLP
jgi:hypothetical protein